MPVAKPGDSILEEVLVVLGKGRNAESGVTKDEIKPLVVPVYDRVRKNCIKSFYWTFAEGEAKLTMNDKKPLFGFDAYYELPADFLQVSYVNGNNVYLQGWQGGWHIVGDLMAANFQPTLSYMKDVTNDELYPSHFRGLFIKKLAAEICLSVTGDKDLTAFLHKEAMIFKRDSIAIEYVDHGQREEMIVDNIAYARRSGSLQDGVPNVDQELTPIRSMSGGTDNP